MSDSLEVVANRIAQLSLHNVPGIGRVGNGPVLSVVRDTTNGKIFVGLNNGPPDDVADALQKSIRTHKWNLAMGNVEVVHTEALARKGGHSEVCALNAAVRAREAELGRKLKEIDFKVFELHNVWLKGSDALSTAARCEHCARITRGVSVTQSLFEAEGGVMGEVTVPQRGMIKRMGAIEPEAVTTANGTISSSKGRRGASAGGPSAGEFEMEGGEAGEMMSGLLTAALILAEPLIKNWFAEKYLKDKWAKEEREMVESAIKNALPRLNILILAHYMAIQKAKAAGQKVILHVCVDTQWVATDFGPAQIGADVSYYDLLFEGDTPVEWPLFQPKHWFGPTRSTQRESFAIKL